MSPSKLHHVTIALLVALLAACGGASARKGPSTRTTPPPGARPGDEAVVDDGWGVGLLVDPAIATTQVDETHFDVDTITRGDLEAGVFRFTARRSDVTARAGSAAYVLMRREEAEAEGRGEQLSPVTEIRFLGRAGHAITFVDRGRGANGLWVAMVQGHCLFELVVLRSGPPEWMTDYASLVLRNIRSLTGKPVDAARCR